MKFQFLIVTMLSAGLLAAQLPADKQLQKSPYWIAMINDSTANYFDAVHAFDQYWSVRPKPVEEDAILGAGEEHESREGFFDRMITTQAEKAEMESQQYAFDYKRFRQWQLRIEPWVRPDGTITFPSQQLKIMQQAAQH